MPTWPEAASSAPAFTASPAAVSSTRTSGVCALTSSTDLPAATKISPFGLVITASFWFSTCGATR
ncbi:hypothetical protein D3C83_15780 [compost metagenome]